MSRCAITKHGGATVLKDVCDRTRDGGVLFGFDLFKCLVHGSNIRISAGIASVETLIICNVEKGRLLDYTLGCAL